MTALPLLPEMALGGAQSMRRALEGRRGASFTREEAEDALYGVLNQSGLWLGSEEKVRARLLAAIEGALDTSFAGDMLQSGVDVSAAYEGLLQMVLEMASPHQHERPVKGWEQAKALLAKVTAARQRAETALGVFCQGQGSAHLELLPGSEEAGNRGGRNAALVLAREALLADAEPTDDELPAVVRVPPRAYLRAVLSLAWGAFRHPLRATCVDLSTGQAVRT